MKYLTIEEAIRINQKLILSLSPKETIGIKDQNMLESAISRPQQSVFGEDAYPSIFDKATALFESLAKNHPFHNGNKRTAFACMYYFLYVNGYILKMDQKEAEDFTVNMVNHKYTFSEVSEILERHSENIN